MKKKIVMTAKTNYQKFLLLGLLLGLVAGCIGTIKVYEDKLRSQRESLQKHTAIIAPDYDPKTLKADEQYTSKVAPVSVDPTRNKIYRLPIVMYHYVEYVQDENDTIRKSLNINPSVFDAEMSALKDQNYDMYFAKEIPSILSGEKQISTKSAVLTFDDGYEDFYTYAFPILKKYGRKATIYIIYDFIGRRGFLNEKEVREIVDSGLVEIGSHTMDHLYLKAMSRVAAMKQITDSKKELENLFGIHVETFAYPYGAYNQETADLVKQASYSAAVSTLPGVYHNLDQRFVLTRVRAGAFSGRNITKVLESLKK